MAREREVKLAVDVGFDLPPLAGAVIGASDESPTEAVRTNVDTYYDTTDLRLVRWGCTLRHRRGEGWTVKLPVPAKGRALVRDEIDFDGRSDRVPAAARDLVGPFSRGAELVRVARLETTRTAAIWATADETTIPLVELADDDVAGQRYHSNGGDGGSETVHFRQLEAELLSGDDPAMLDALTDRLVAAGAELDPQARKLVRVLGSRALEPADVVASPVGAKASARDVIGHLIAASTIQLVLQLPAARLGHDIEGVHRARVATRRLRSDLRTFGPLLDIEATRALSTALRPLAHALGAVRDADVLLERLEATLAAHPEIDADAGRRVIAHLEVEQADARAAMVKAIADADTTYRLLDHLVATATNPPTTARADKRASAVLPPLVAKRWHRLSRAVDRLGDDPKAVDLHAVRILTKRVRYAADAVAPAIGRDAKRLARALAEVQDVLGLVNDTSVTEAWLHSIVDHLDPAAAFAAGRLASVAAADREQYRQGWEAAYGAASARKLRRWLS